MKERVTHDAYTKEMENFASDKISDVQKEQLAAKLLETPEIELQCVKPENPYVYEDSELTEFINEDSWIIFQLCSIEISFLSLPVSDWPRTENFQAFLPKCLTELCWRIENIMLNTIKKLSA